MPAARKLIVDNRKARHDYHILERVEAGIALTGTEVKSLRDGGGNIRESYAQLRNGEVFLVGANIAPYRQGNLQNHEPVRDRKLLLHRRDARGIAGARPPDAHRRCRSSPRMARSICRLASRSAIAWRLSTPSLPFARPSSTFTRPFVK